ncbi:MAG TPA: zinc ABC transporter substrate-binding protein [Acidimicrobiia bacterium]|nr:zinc ABC transporter substrate-binding protein [Acidimicrobiia bacterium]
MSLSKFTPLLICTVAFSLALTGCSKSLTNADKTIVTSSYPLEFIVHEIVRDDFVVENLTPVGAEAHELELSPGSTEKVLNAQLVVVMGKGFQPAVEKTSQSRDGKTVDVLDEILDGEENVDPHFWLDPILYKKAVGTVADSLIALNPSQKKVYESRRDTLLNKLDDLDRSFETGLSQCDTRTFITSHDAFSRLAKRYDLVQEPIAGISPENEPSPARLSQLAELATQKNVTTVFTEELVSNKVSRALSSEAGLKTEVLSPLEGLTEKQADAGSDYFSLMQENLVKLARSLRCVPDQ